MDVYICERPIRGTRRACVMFNQKYDKKRQEAQENRKKVREKEEIHRHGKDARRNSINMKRSYF